MNAEVSEGYTSFPQKRESIAAGLLRSPWTPAFAGVTGNALILPASSRVGHSKHKEDQERDGEAEKAGRLGQRKAEKGERLHLALRGRVAGDRVDQSRKHIADADAGTHQGNAGETGADHFGG